MSSLGSKQPFAALGMNDRFAGQSRHSMPEPETSDIQPIRLVTASCKLTLFRGETTVSDVNQFWS